MATEDEITDMAMEAEMVRLEYGTTTSEDGEPAVISLWQAILGDPVYSTIQVSAKDETEAHENLATAAWEMMQNRQQAIEAAETPIDPDENYNPPESG